MRDPATEDLHQRASEVVRSLHALCAVRPGANGDEIEALLKALGRYEHAAHAPLRLQLVTGALFANGRLIQLDAWTYDRALDLALRLVQRGIGTIHFPSACTAQQLDGFSRALARSRLDSLPLHGGETGGFRFDPPGVDADGRAATGVNDLMVVLDRELEDLRQGSDLLRVKRLLIIMGQALDRAALAVPTGASLARDTVALMAFATWLGLGRRDRVVMGLCTILLGVHADAGPDALPALIAAHPGLGELAESVVCTATAAGRLVDSAVPQEQAGHPLGSVLAMLLEYLDGRIEEVPPSAATLLAFERRWGDASLLLTAWIGAPPVELPQVEIFDDDSHADDSLIDDETTAPVSAATMRRVREGDGWRWVPRRFRRGG